LSEKSSSSRKKTFLDVPAEDILEFAASKKVPPFHVRQVFEWFFRKGAMSFADMTNLPLAYRKSMEARYQLHPLKLVKKDTSELDGTIRYYFKGHDGKEISTVFLPEADRLSLCLSTQVGCAYRCGFCASGLVPFQRQLSAAEILDQILLIQKDSGRQVTNLLFMGMGEPLANYTQVLQSIRWITSTQGIGMSPSRVTLSTSGLIPQIRKMADDGMRVKLAISLHAVQDDVREKIMPVSGKFGVRELIKAAKYYSLKSKAEVTFEYILLKGVNDRLHDAIRLAYLTKGFQNHVNLIPYNPVAGLSFERPTSDSVERFQHWLRQRGVPVFIRKPKGLDIGSACGQLGAAA
jgi:23S rRNA (adenine2503-C2)-methyltransferase